MIEVNELSKSYGEVVAVEGVSFAVGKGTILGFLGSQWCRQDNDDANVNVLLAAERWSGHRCGF